MRISSVALLSCALLLLTLTGCPAGDGGANMPDRVPVSGTVTLDGEPVEGVSVMFGTGGFGETDASGRYEAGSGAGEKGVPAGDYTVTCEKWVMPDGSVFRSTTDADGETMSPMLAGAEPGLPGEYGSDVTSGLTATVPAAGSDSVDFDLTSDFTGAQAEE
jgi:hypothetical protein